LTLYAVAGVVIAILANIAQLYTTKDYADETIRGKRILSVSSEKTTQPAGLEWDFASEFSDGYLDLVSMIVPGFVGGSMREKTSKTSGYCKRF
jgi:hypothetical protein